MELVEEIESFLNFSMVSVVYYMQAGDLNCS